MRTEIRRGLFSANSLLAGSIILLSLLGYSIPMWGISAGSTLEYRASALEQSIGGIFFGGIILLFPLCAALPYAISQVDDIHSGFIFLQSIRTKVWRYACRKSFCSMIAGGLCIAGPFLLHCLLWNCIALPYMPSAYPDQEIIFRGLYNDWSRIAYALPMYIWIALGLFLCGALWALLALASAIWIPDKLVAVMLPIGICYFWTYGLFSHWLGMPLPTPSGLYNDGLSWQRLFQSLGMNSLLGIVTFLLYFAGLQRGLRHG